MPSLSSLTVPFLLLTSSFYTRPVLADISDITPCPGLCSGQGHCDRGNMVCECFKGFTGPDCSLRTCPLGHAWTDFPWATDKSHALSECSNRGVCDRQTGTCSCEAARFEGTACDRMVCRDACSGFGRCQSMKAIAATRDPGELRAACGFPQICKSTGSACVDPDYTGCLATYTYNTRWDADMIYGCVCDTGYSGPNCARKECPTGDDPLTGSAYDTYTAVQERQIITCQADGGTFTLTFMGATTAEISSRASISDVIDKLQALPTVKPPSGSASIKVEYKGTATNACTNEGNAITVTFVQNYGLLDVKYASRPAVSLLIPDGKKLTLSLATASPSITSSEAVISTKENYECSNRGVCDTDTGVCTCATNFDTSDGYGAPGTRGDCGYYSTSITACPGEVSCTGQGVCSGPPTYTCQCKAGYTGTDCSRAICPSGKNWFGYPSKDNTAHDEMAECSGAGDCDYDAGACTCLDGFEGAACQRMKCPGDPVCNDHGECLTLFALAQKATVNGDLAGFTYGAIPNDPATWDADKVQGCYCAEGFEGYDCSQKSCPMGDDPSTKHQSNELQEFFCQSLEGDSEKLGVFTMQFRQKDTIELKYNSKLADLKAALEALTTIESVLVYFEDPTVVNPASAPLCTTAGTRFLVEFLSPTGDVPNIQVTKDSIAILDQKETVKGTKEYAPCSNRGLCDYESGLCTCVVGFVSSDGQGHAGILNDCGYKSPIVVSSG